MDSTVNLASEFRASIAAARAAGLVGVGDDAGISLAGRLAEAIDGLRVPDDPGITGRSVPAGAGGAETVAAAAWPGLERPAGEDAQ